MPLSFVVAINNKDVYEKNILASPVFQKGHQHEIIARYDFPSVSLAYNSVIDEVKNNILVFIHQDVYLPEGWDKRLINTISSLKNGGVNLGVIGCYGVSSKGLRFGHIFSNGLRKELGKTSTPQVVKSIDELLLCFMKSSGLRFDPLMPHFHLYGTDICLEAEKRGLTNYAISNFCVHNSLPVKKLPKEFWECAEYIRKKWRKELPVESSCIKIYPNKLNMLYTRILYEINSLRTYRNRFIEKRLDDPASIVDKYI